MLISHTHTHTHTQTHTLTSVRSEAPCPSASSSLSVFFHVLKKDKEQKRKFFESLSPGSDRQSQSHALVHDWVLKHEFASAFVKDKVCIYSVDQSMDLLSRCVFVDALLRPCSWMRY